MPLFKEWSPNAHSLAAIWHIDEAEAFFRDKTGLKSHIKHPRKRIEHLCGRYLLQHLKEDFPLHHIAPDIHDKPRLPGDRYFFSISHSYPYVAAVISDREECGIDIQVWKKSIEAIAYMYLSDQEQDLCAGEGTLLTLVWTAKEAVYKWWGRRGADFIRDLPIHSLMAENPIIFPQGTQRTYSVIMDCFNHSIVLKALLHKDFALSFIVQSRSVEDK